MVPKIFVIFSCFWHKSVTKSEGEGSDIKKEKYLWKYLLSSTSSITAPRYAYFMGRNPNSKLSTKKVHWIVSELTHIFLYSDSRSCDFTGCFVDPGINFAVFLFHQRLPKWPIVIFYFPLLQFVSQESDGRNALYRHVKC